MNINGAVPVYRVLEKLDSYLRQNDYSGAKRLLLYWVSEAQSMNDEKSVLLFYNELMGLCRKLSEKEEALKFARNALMLVEKLNIKENVGAATTYINSATVYKAFGMASESIELFEKAKNIYESNLSSDDERLGGLYNNMALALADLKRFEEADSFYKKALTVMKSVLGKEPEQAITYLNMATAAEMQFGLENAKEMIAEYAVNAKELLEIGKDRTDGNYAFVCEKCASVFGYYGYTDYEEKLKKRYRRIYEGA